MDESKRRFLRNTLYGAGALGLRSLATGIPAAILANPLRATADTGTTTAKYLVLVTSGGGDPLNANVPGCYRDGSAGDQKGLIYHPTDPAMAATSMTVGGQSVKAALPWTQLDQYGPSGTSILGRTCFVHHGTYTNAHGDHPKVNRLMGAVARQEMLISLIAKQTSSSTALNTVQPQPVVLANNLITFKGAVLPTLSPLNLQAVLTTNSKSAFAQLQKLRDTELDALNALYKSHGNQAQQAILGTYANSQTQARMLSDQLLADLSTIKDNSRTGQNIAAAVLFKMNVSSVMVMGWSFGGDNHQDVGLANETAQTIASTQAIGDLITRLSAPSYNLQDKVMIAFQNVFGRTLHPSSHSDTTDGRNHNATSHCSVFIGSAFKSALIGGVKLNQSGNDFQATGFDSATGASSDTGDIPYEQTLASAGKTLAFACGVPQAVIDDPVTGITGAGKVIKAALA